VAIDHELGSKLDEIKRHRTGPLTGWTIGTLLKYSGLQGTDHPCSRAVMTAFTSPDVSESFPEGVDLLSGRL
jgi:hypothetical protein